MITANTVPQLPDAKGFYGNYGGSFIPPALQEVMDEIEAVYAKLRMDEDFQNELTRLFTHYTGRPTPVFHAKNISGAHDSPQIYLKREDLNHTGAHKINHCLGETLLAKRMGKKKLIAETGAGQHGVALATAAALLGMECEIYMGAVDVEKEHPNVVRMKILGATVVPVEEGRKTLKEAVDAAFTAYLKDTHSQFYAIGSVVGPHPFPMMVRDFQSVVGREARRQFLELTGKLPDCAVACVGGGSNAIGLFSGFIADEKVALYGVEAAGRGLTDGNHAATLTLGSPGIIHGFKCYLLQDEKGQPRPVYSMASGLDYPGVGPEHSHLKDTGRVKYAAISDEEAIAAFFALSRQEGIIPALESAHALAYALKLAKELPGGTSILVNLSGRGDKDIDFVARQYGTSYSL